METTNYCKYGHKDNFKLNSRGHRICRDCEARWIASRPPKEYIHRPRKEWSATFGEAICPADGVKFVKRVVNHKYCDIFCQEREKGRRKRARHRGSEQPIS